MSNFHGFVSYNPNAHGVVHLRDWKMYLGDDEGAEVEIMEYQPTGLRFFATSDFDDNEIFSFGVLCQNPPSDRVELIRVGQQAIRFYCAQKKTTPDAEQRRAEEWRSGLKSQAPAITNGIAKITNEMRKHVRDDFLLIFADDPADIAALEADCKLTQAQQIDEFVEKTCWSDELKPEQITTPYDRKINLRAAMIKGQADPLSQLAEKKAS